MESSEEENAPKVKAFGGVFIDKNSKKFPVDLGDAIRKDFGFGDFVIRDPETGEELLRIHDLKDLQRHIFDIPAKSLFYHASYNDISRWLYSRALFPIAEVIKLSLIHISYNPYYTQAYCGCRRSSRPAVVNEREL